MASGSSERPLEILLVEASPRGREAGRGDSEIFESPYEHHGCGGRRRGIGPPSQGGRIRGFTSSRPDIAWHARHRGTG